MDRVTPGDSSAPHVVVDSTAPLQTSEVSIDDNLVGALVALFDKIGGRSWFNFNYSAGPSAYPVTLTYPELDYTDIRPIIYHQIPKPTFPLCEACLQGWYLLYVLALGVLVLWVWLATQSRYCYRVGQAFSSTYPVQVGRALCGFVGFLLAGGALWLLVGWGLVLNDIPKTSSQALLDFHRGWRKLGLSVCTVLGLVLIRGFLFILRPERGFKLNAKQALPLIIGVSAIGFVAVWGLFSLAHVSGGCDKLLETHRAGLKIAALNPLEVVLNHAIELRATGLSDMGGMANAYRLATLIRARSGEEWSRKAYHRDLDIEAIMGPAG